MRYMIMRCCVRPRNSYDAKLGCSVSGIGLPLLFPITIRQIEHLYTRWQRLGVAALRTCRRCISSWRCWPHWPDLMLSIRLILGSVEALYRDQWSSWSTARNWKLNACLFRYWRTCWDSNSERNWFDGLSTTLRSCSLTFSRSSIWEAQSKWGKVEEGQRRASSYLCLSRKYIKLTFICNQGQKVSLEGYCLFVADCTTGRMLSGWTCLSTEPSS